MLSQLGDGYLTTQSFSPGEIFGLLVTWVPGKYVSVANFLAYLGLFQAFQSLALYNKLDFES